MEDFYGYSRDVKPNGQVTSSEFATLSIDGHMDLVQQVQATYMQTVNAKFEVGSPTLYWVTGQPQGTITFARLVGKGGFFSKFSSLKGSCGKVVGLKVGLDGSGGCTTVQASGNTVSFDGGVAEQVSLSFQAGVLEVTEGATVRVASMAIK